MVLLHSGNFDGPADVFLYENDFMKIFGETTEKTASGFLLSGSPGPAVAISRV
jgi:hypothetical protein